MRAKLVMPNVGSHCFSLRLAFAVTFFSLQKQACTARQPGFAFAVTFFSLQKQACTARQPGFAFAVTFFSLQRQICRLQWKILCRHGFASNESFQPRPSPQSPYTILSHSLHDSAMPVLWTRRTKQCRIPRRVCRRDEQTDAGRRLHTLR